ncbi:MAG TPA: hypothetical protein VHE35_22950 [Kofleriaceae bacterium]|nr:hypothetical protein [Kofleriaceae bacterium]
MSVRSVRSQTPRAPARRGLACPLAIAALLAAPAAARADRKPVVVVDGTSDGAGAQAVADLDGQLAREEALGPPAVDVDAALRTAVDAPVEWEAEATAALGEARADLARFDYRKAADRTRDALDRLAAAADQPAARKALAELALLEGQALVGAGDADGAVLSLRLVHRFDPDARLDPARYLPEVVTAYLAAGRAAEATARLQVDAPGADEVLVDGAVVGGERQIVDVTPGPHLVSVRGEAIVTLGRRIDAPAGQEMYVELAPKVAPLPVRIARGVARLRVAAAAADADAALLDAVQTLAALAQATDAVVVVHGDAGIATRLYTPAGGLRPARPLGEPAQTLAPLRPLAVPPHGRQQPPAPIVPPAPWYRQRWGKTSIGIGVAVVLGGIVTAMIVRDPGTSTFTGKAGVE